jgi:L-amino acid N-acyltransferase YncA
MTGYTSRATANGPKSAITNRTACAFSAPNAAAACTKIFDVSWFHGTGGRQPAEATMQIRLATANDAPEILAIYSGYFDTAITFELQPPSLDEMRSRIVHTLEEYPYIVAVDQSGDIVGYAYAHSFRDRPAYRWSVETSIYVHRQKRTKGVGKLLYTKLLDILRRQGFVIAMAGITLPNEASVRLHESFGFRRVGSMPDIGYKDGEWHEVAFLALELNKPTKNPAEPRDYRELVEELKVAAT